MDHSGINGVVDSLGDWLASPGWLLIGLYEVGMVAANQQPINAQGGDTLLMHAIDCLPGLLTAYMGYEHLKDRRAARRERQANDSTTNRMRLENDRFEMENRRLLLENERINLEVKRLEVELKLKETPLPEKGNPHDQA